MPATRSGLRQGSRQPAPYPQDVAGPSNLNAIHVVVDDDGPPRKRQAVERKAPRQRSKQRAKAPLPPPSEIIEISSDDEPAPRKSTGPVNAIEKRLKELEEENRKLKAALAAAKTAQPPPVPEVKVPTPAPDAATDKLLSTIEDHVSCEVCTLKMWNAYTLACGHTFCRGCLQDWFSTAHVHHLANHPTYDPQQLIPHQWRVQLARPDLSPHQRRHIERAVLDTIATTSHPKYSCPTCRVLIRAKPAENFVVKHLVQTVAAVQGESPPKEPTRTLKQALEGPFDGFFPFPLYDLSTT